MLQKLDNYNKQVKSQDAEIKVLQEEKLRLRGPRRREVRRLDRIPSTKPEPDCWRRASHTAT